MPKLIFGMNLSLDSDIAAPGDDLGWSGPSETRTFPDGVLLTRYETRCEYPTSD